MEGLVLMLGTVHRRGSARLGAVLLGLLLRGEAALGQGMRGEYWVVMTGVNQVIICRVQMCQFKILVWVKTGEYTYEKLELVLVLRL